MRHKQFSKILFDLKRIFNYKLIGSPISFIAKFKNKKHESGIDQVIMY